MVRHRARGGPGATPEDVAAFAETHIAELRDLAEGAGLAFLAYFSTSRASKPSTPSPGTRPTGSIAGQ